MAVSEVFDAPGALGRIQDPRPAVRVIKTLLRHLGIDSRGDHERHRPLSRAS
jgi:hypothetical protein